MEEWIKDTVAEEDMMEDPDPILYQRFTLVGIHQDTEGGEDRSECGNRNMNLVARLLSIHVEGLMSAFFNACYTIMVMVDHSWIASFLFYCSHVLPSVNASFSLLFHRT